jgi:hypothetical protein
LRQGISLHSRFRFYDQRHHLRNLQFAGRHLTAAFTGQITPVQAPQYSCESHPKGEVKSDVNRLAIVLTATAVSIAGATAAEPGQSQSLPALPRRILTTDGKTYDSVRLLRAEPDGLVIEHV